MHKHSSIPTLLHACMKKQASAERALFDRLAPDVMAIARRYARDEPEAMDYLQDCFIHLFDKLSGYDPERGPFEPWMRTLCVRVILQQLRKRKRTATVALPATLEEEWVDPPAMETLDEPVVLAIIRELPAGYREVFNLYVFEEWSHREIAQALGISESASRSQLVRARQAIQFLLKKKITHEYDTRVI